MYVYIHTDKVNLVFLIQKIQLECPQIWRDWSKIQDQPSGCEIKLTGSGAAKGQKGNSELYLDSTVNSKQYLADDPMIQW